MGHPFFSGHLPTRRGCSRGGFRDRCWGAERQCQEKAGPWKADQWRATGARHGACEERRSEASEADIQTKIESLSAMGFYETGADETFEELLGRYGGNVERVVQVLLQRQQGGETGKVNGYDL